MSSFTSTLKKLFSFQRLRDDNNSLSPMDKLSFFNDISFWENPPKCMYISFEDPRFFDKKSTLLLKVTGYFSIRLDKKVSSDSDRKYAILILEKERQIYSLISCWEENSLVDLYFSYLLFPLGLSRELFLSQGFLKDLFVAPEQLDFILGYLEYSSCFSLDSSYLSLENRGESKENNKSFFEIEGQYLGSFRSSLKINKEFSLLWREYSLRGSDSYSKELDIVFLQEMTSSLNSTIWEERGGELILWIGKKIKEKNIEFFC